MSCYMCKNCNIETAKELIYQIHVTIKPEKQAVFEEVCLANNIKPIVIQNWNGEGSYIDIFTSSVVKANPIDELRRVSNLLQASGFKVLREKIETVPWYPHTKLEDGMYYECHMKVPASIPNTFFEKLGLLVSKKEVKNHKIITYRQHKGTLAQFQAHVDSLISIIHPDRTIIELTLYDSNLAHDDRWQKGIR